MARSGVWLLLRWSLAWFRRRSSTVGSSERLAALLARPWCLALQGLGLEVARKDSGHDRGGLVARCRLWAACCFFAAATSLGLVKAVVGRWAEAQDVSRARGIGARAFLAGRWGGGGEERCDCDAVKVETRLREVAAIEGAQASRRRDRSESWLERLRRRRLNGQGRAGLTGGWGGLGSREQLRGETAQTRAKASTCVGGGE